MFDLLYVYSSKNRETIIQYNRISKETIKCYMNCVRRTENIREKIQFISNAMFNPDVEQKKIMILNLVKMFFNQEIEFIFSNRRKIRISENIDWNTELFRLLKKTNPNAFVNFQNIVATELLDVAKKGYYDEIKLKDLIAEIISLVLQHDFICLKFK
jgi:hypothetical protein